MKEKEALLAELSNLRSRIAKLEANEQKLKKTEEKLKTTNQQLDARNQQLLANEQQLQSTQETLIRTQNIARLGSWEWEIATDTVTWSDELFQIFRLNAENGAISYTDHPKIYTPESMRQLDKAVQHALETGEPYKIDLEIIRSDGTSAFCEAQGFVKKDENGNVIQLFGSLQDIAERKNTEEELRKSEEKLRIVLDNNPFPIAVVDETDHDIKYWSESAVRLFGHHPSTTEEWYKLAYPNPKYRQQVVERWKPFLEIAQDSTKAINTGEYEITCKNGTVKTCEIYAQFIPGNLIVTMNDITDSKNSTEKLTALNQQLLANEQQLRALNVNLEESEKQFRELFENMAQGFALHEMIYDENNHPVDYRFLHINKSFEKLTGINASDYIGKTVKQVIPKIEQIWIDNYGQVAKTAQPLQFEHYAKEFDKYYHVTAYSPKKNFFATVFTDTTQDKLQRKQLVGAKEKAEESENKYRNLIETASDAIYLVSQDGIVIEANQGAFKMLGKERDEIVGHSIYSIDPSFSIKEYLAFWREIPFNKQLVFESTHQHRNGDLIPVEISAKKYQQDGKVYHYSIARDITDRKQSEAELKKIEWLLQPRKEKLEIGIPNYGNLTTINQDRTILDSVGKEVLNGIVTDYLSLLETSAAVYEKNGDYAVGIFSSEWCQFMDCSSRSLCKSKDNKKALDSGHWLCHESCWADASHQSIQTNKPVDIECSGGLHIYAIPVRANNEVIGSINFGYGNPPTDEYQLNDIAAKYIVSLDKLKELAKRYETRPAFIIDIAKEKLESSARLIGTIVERKQMEEDLLKNQKRYQKAQEMGHVGNWEYDPLTTNFWASDEAKRIYGYDLNMGSFSTEMVENCIPERERVHQALLDLLEHNTTYDLVFDIITNDKGIRKTIHSIATAERDTQGKAIKITGVISDITLQKKTEDHLKALNQQLSANEQQLRASNQQLQANEQQLRAANQQLQATTERVEESEERFNLAMKASNDGLFDWNLETNEIYYSPGWKKMLGYEDHEIPNDFSIWEKTTAPEDVKKSWEMQRKLIAKEIDRFVMEFKMKHKNGHWIDVLSRAKAFFNDSGKAIRMVGTHHDITERKQSEIELINAKETAEKNQSNITAIIEGTNNSIWAFNTNYQILYINQVMQQEFLQTFGVLLEPGSSLIEALPKSLRPFWNPRYDRVLANEQFTVEDAVPTDHGTLYIQVSFNPIVKNGQVIGGTCIGSNITQRKLAEIQLFEAKEKAEESDRLKSAFLANMSHEIRTPMNGILGFTNLLQKPNLTGEEQQKYINIIQKSGGRMLNTVNDIIDISRIESGLVELSLSEINIYEQLNGLHSFFNHEASKKGVRLMLNNDGSEQEKYFRTDLEKFNSIVTNLIKNAIKFTNEGTIELGYAINKEHDTTQLKLYVKDTGIGIPEDRLEAIFDRFVQADIEDKKAMQGSGLGLAISKAYTEMLGGRLWVESTEGIGSTFYCTMKNTSKTELKIKITTDNQLLPEDNLNGNLNILIVEDDETSQQLISILAEKFARKMVKVRTGSEAVEVCQNNSDIDLILMDIQLPDMNGYDATHMIRQFNKEVVIFAQTAFALTGDKEKAMRMGCDDYISKPIDESELDSLIKKYSKKYPHLNTNI